ncbi:unnamed protein product [marine sediment metagenome]|uniref:Uncharacterized protein n=1 Tax=marine sediment metagenome TaxID=412755 RepID=X1AWI2_9ZZZZ
MSLVLYIFIFYIIISLLSRIGNKKRRSHILMRKEEDKAISIFSEIQDEAGSPEEKRNIKQVDNIEKKDKIIIDDEVKEFYRDKGEDKEKRALDRKTVAEDREEISSGLESGLGIYLSDDVLINGIILSEILAPPRALRPYDFQRYKRLR